MDRMISDSDLARLYLSLEGVQLVRDLLVEGETEADGFDLDLLASILSECPPEKCLLVLACAAGTLCDHIDLDPALKMSLKMLSGDVLDDYAPLYLAHLKSHKMDGFEGQIIYMQEDLESFAELFALAGDLSPLDSIQYRICAVLSDQACAQAEFLDDEEANIDYNIAPVVDDTPTLIVFSDNVIPFPGLFRKA
jgi:hypothetical protein